MKGIIDMIKKNWPLLTVARVLTFVPLTVVLRSRDPAPDAGVRA